MTTLDLFHGADSQKLLYYISHGSLTTDSQGKHYIAQSDRRKCLVHGADSTTKESYVLKVRINIPQDIVIERSPRPGNEDALILTTIAGRRLPCEFLEMYVRSGKVGEFETMVITGSHIEGYLIACYQTL